MGMQGVTCVYQVLEEAHSDEMRLRHPQQEWRESRVLLCLPS